MKTRSGFVSNSSSSSFILLAKEPLTQEFIKKEYAGKGPFALPTIEFLCWKQNDGVEHPDAFPVEMKRYLEPAPNSGPHCHEEKVKDGYFIVEYEITNQGEGEVSRALYYDGYAHLKTKNIKVFPGTVYG